MASFNKVIFMGHLTIDPMVKPVGQSKVATYAVAANHKYRKADKTVVEDTCFLDVECWGTEAEVSEKYLKKGSGVMLEGRLKQNSWKDKSGFDRSKHVLVAEKVLLIDAKQTKDERESNQVQNNPAFSKTVREIDRQFGVKKIEVKEAPSAEAIDDLPF